MPGRVSFTPVQDRSRKTQQDLLDSLERLLSKKPMNELTVAEIAGDAGVTTGALYRRFRDKRDLLRAAFDRFLERTEQGTAVFAYETSGLSDHTILELVITHTLYFTLDYIPLMRAAAAVNDIPSFDRMREARNLSADLLAERLTTSRLSEDELGPRARFTMRMVTAVVRDTFLAGPGARDLSLGGDSRAPRNKTILVQLIAQLTAMSVSYLQLEPGAVR